MKNNNDRTEEFKLKEHDLMAKLIDLEQAKDQTEESKLKQHDLIGELIDLEQAKDFANQNAFLDAPVTTRTLVAVVALAVQEIRNFHHDAGFTYFTTLHQDLWDMVKDDLHYTGKTNLK